MTAELTIENRDPLSLEEVVPPAVREGYLKTVCGSGPRGPQVNWERGGA